jgi:hypothetical protein
VVQAVTGDLQALSMCTLADVHNSRSHLLVFFDEDLPKIACVQRSAFHVGDHSYHLQA